MLVQLHAKTPAAPSFKAIDTAWPKGGCQLDLGGSILDLMPGRGGAPSTAPNIMPVVCLTLNSAMKTWCSFSELMDEPHRKEPVSDAKINA